MTCYLDKCITVKKKTLHIFINIVKNKVSIKVLVMAITTDVDCFMVKNYNHYHFHFQFSVWLKIQTSILQ